MISAWTCPTTTYAIQRNSRSGAHRVRSSEAAYADIGGPRLLSRRANLAAGVHRRMISSHSMEQQERTQNRRGASANEASSPRWATLAALGVVFGDLGTSPLYTLQTVVGATGGQFTAQSALGILSAIIWTLILTISVKYCLFVMRADNSGEGGILALMSLIGANGSTPGVRILTGMGLLGAALIYGDGVITPAISVLSALEGVNVVTASFKPYVMPAAVAILVGVFLCITGGEALYADMGHFGKGPIRLAWYAIVLPALLLSYAGQTAFMMDKGSVSGNPFFQIAPAWSIYPLVVLATLATIIASQAIITGSFSMTRQARSLGWLPGVSIRQTSDRIYGQIYVPVVNWLLMAATVVVTIAFGSSDRLAGAYGTAVSTTMFLTTCVLYKEMAAVWRWPP